MISHRHRCIYVKVPKCASTSVLEWFVAHGAGRNSFRPFWYGGLQARRLPEVTRLLNLYPDYFTFTFVRCPYRRFVSIWRDARRRAAPRFPDPRTRPAEYGSLREFAELCAELMEDLAPLWGREAQAFFDRNLDREYGPQRIPLRHLLFVSDHARAQVDFLPDRNPQRLFGVRRVNDDPLSFVGRVETLEADFRRLRGMLNLPRAALLAYNASPGPPGADEDCGYRAHYDDATRRLVEALFAADLDFTGARFHDGGVTVAVSGLPSAARRKRPVRRRTPATLPARAWSRLCALEVRAEAWVRRFAALRLVFRPLVRLRGFSR